MRGPVGAWSAFELIFPRYFINLESVMYSAYTVKMLQ